MAAIFPNYTAGQRLTAADLQAGQYLVVQKVVTTTRASTTAIADDPELSFQLAANAQYLIEFFLHYAAVDLAKIDVAWTVPSGASGNRGVRGLASTVSDSSGAPAGGGAGSLRSGVHGFGTEVTYGTRNSNTLQCLATEESLVTTSSAGTCAVQWAQNASSTTGTVMAVGSWARALRIA